MSLDIELDAEILTKILKLRDKGFEDHEIAEKLGILGGDIVSQELYALEAARDLAEDGTTDITKITEKLVLPEQYIQKIASDFELPITITTTEKPVPKGRLIETLKQLQQERKSKKKKNRREVRRYKKTTGPAKKYKQYRPSKKSLEKELETEPTVESVESKEIKRIEAIDCEVLAGLPLNLLGKKGGLNAEQTKKYLETTGQYILWKEYSRPEEPTGKTKKVTEQIITPEEILAVPEEVIERPRKIRKTTTRKAGTEQRGRPKTEFVRDPEIDEALPLGFTVEELEELTGKKGIGYYIKETKQLKTWKTGRAEEKKRGKKIKRKPDLDELIDQGEELSTMAEEGFIGEQGARNYMIRTDKYEKWKIKRRETRQQRKNLLKNLIYSVIKNAESKASEVEKKVYWKADEFFKETKIKRISHESVATVLRNYFNAEEKGETPTSFQLREGTNLSITEINRILREMNLESPTEKREMPPVSQWEEQAIERAFYSNLGATDISNLLDVSIHVVSHRLIRIKKLTGQKRPEIKKFIVQLPKTDEHPTMPILTYTLASQIYEQKDVGISREKIKKDLGVEKRIVDYALEHEHEIAPKIIAPIQMIFPDEKVDVPYVKAEWEKH